MSDDAGMDDVAEHANDDGSICRVNIRGPRSYVVSLYIGERCVWGQAFSLADTETRDQWIAEVVGHMRTDPRAYYRWNLTK